MAKAGDRGPRSEARRRPHATLVRWTPEEWQTLADRVAAWNAGLPPSASSSARMTVARLAREATLRRSIPSPSRAVRKVGGLSAADLGKLARLNEDVNRLGNLLRAYMRHGRHISADRVRAARDLDAGERMTAEEILAQVEAAIGEVRRLAGKDG